MELVKPGHRIYFAAVGVLALWVGMWGYFSPAQVDSAIPWLVPPLHARFLGSMYLSGAAFMVGCILARRSSSRTTSVRASSGGRPCRACRGSSWI